MCQILKGSAYRTRSANFQQNIDLRHIQEIWRFQAGQALQLSSIPPSTQDLLALATRFDRFFSFPLGYHATISVHKLFTMFF